jgi:S-adenosylmethionine hydrolase
MAKFPIITILTDFGQRDAYVAAMKGTILELAPNAKIVDIAHDITRHNIIQAAFILLNSSKYFPMNTIHLVVVDPGVGTERRRIIVQGNRSCYVGPDNGVLSLAIQEEGLKKIVLISERKYMRSNVTTTFEGRDIFAPAAAHLAQGVPIESFGRKVDRMKQLLISHPNISDHHISGEIIHTDGFGNIITNITDSQIQELMTIGQQYQVTINQTTKPIKYMRSYGYVSPRELVIIIGSSKYIEISINQGNAQKLFRAKTGDPIAITS